MDDRRAYLALRKWQANIIALLKTNKNWELEWLCNQWANEVNKVWHDTKVYTSRIKNPISKQSKNVQGGVGLIVTKKLASRIVENRSDAMR